MRGLDVLELRTAVAAIEALEALDRKLVELNVGEWWPEGPIPVVCCDETYGHIVRTYDIWQYQPCQTEPEGPS